MMKISKYPSDVEGVGIRGKEKIWMEIVIPCQLGICRGMYAQEPTTAPHSAKIKDKRVENNNRQNSMQ